MKQLALPALLAMLLHALAFGLHLPWTRPHLALPEGRPVSITLVETVQAEPSPDKVVKPRPQDKPLAAAPAKRREIKGHPAPKPVPTPEPAMAAPPSKPVASPPPTDGEVLPTEQGPSSLHDESPVPAAAPSSDQAQIKASVPLYQINPSPTYPPLARRRNYQGVVVLDVLVDAQGLAAQVKVAQGSGYRILDQCAVRTVSGWRFEPARRGSRPVEMWVKVPVRFTLR